MVKAERRRYGKRKVSRIAARTKDDRAHKVTRGVSLYPTPLASYCLGEFQRSGMVVSYELIVSATALYQGFRQQLGILKEVAGVFHAAAYISFRIIREPSVARVELVDLQGAQSFQRVSVVADTA